MVVNVKAIGLLLSIYGLLPRWTLISLLKKKKFFLVSIKPQTFLVSDAVFFNSCFLCTQSLHWV